MEKVSSFYHHSEKDFPIGINYYSPTVINKEPYYPQFSSGIAVTVMECGEVEIFTKEKKYTLTGGDIFIMPPRQIHTFRTTTMGTKYTFLSIYLKLITLPEGHYFQQQFTKPLSEGRLLLPDLVRPGDPLYNQLNSIFSVLDRNKEGSDAYKAQLFGMVMQFCTAILPYCKYLDQKPAAAKSEDTVLACMDYIRTYYKERITLQDLADHVHLHPNYLCALFKSRTGRTPFEYVDRVRVRHAYRLLQSTHLPVTEIAETCGFQSISFFSRKFKSILGCSPSQYRKKIDILIPQSDHNFE